MGLREKLNVIKKLKVEGSVGESQCSSLVKIAFFIRRNIIALIAVVLVWTLTVWLPDQGITLKSSVKSLSCRLPERRQCSGVDLSEAKLNQWNLEGANFEDAVLIRAHLQATNLKNANLENAKMFCADLTNANLVGANLNNADLRFADLTGANISGAILGWALFDEGIWDVLPDGTLISNNFRSVFTKRCRRSGNYFSDGGGAGPSNDRCNGGDECYPGFEEEYPESLNDYYDDYEETCIGDCYDMDNDGRTWNDIDRDGDGLYESP